MSKLDELTDVAAGFAGANCDVTLSEPLASFVNAKAKKEGLSLSAQRIGGVIHVNATDLVDFVNKLHGHEKVKSPTKEAPKVEKLTFGEEIDDNEELEDPFMEDGPVNFGAEPVEHGSRRAPVNPLGSGDSPLDADERLKGNTSSSPENATGDNPNLTPGQTQDGVDPSRPPGTGPNDPGVHPPDGPQRAQKKR